jgi:hypothetical protein
MDPIFLQIDSKTWWKPFLEAIIRKCLYQQKTLQLASGLIGNEVVFDNNST